MGENEWKMRYLDEMKRNIESKNHIIFAIGINGIRDGMGDTQITEASELLKYDVEEAVLSFEGLSSDPI